MSRPAGGGFFHCADCRTLTPHDADLLTPARRDEAEFVALTCRVCGHVTAPETR